MTTTTIDQRLQAISQKLDKAQTELREAQSIEIPDTQPPATSPRFPWRAFALGFALGAGVVMLAAWLL
jgi:hypothetical protein